MVKTFISFQWSIAVDSQMCSKTADLSKCKSVLRSRKWHPKFCWWSRPRLPSCPDRDALHGHNSFGSLCSHHHSIQVKLFQDLKSIIMIDLQGLLLVWLSTLSLVLLWQLLFLAPLLSGSSGDWRVVTSVIRNLLLPRTWPSWMWPKPWQVEYLLPRVRKKLLHG